MQYYQVKLLEQAEEFLAGLNPKMKRKILHVLKFAEKSNDPKFFKKLRDDIWEFRIRQWNWQIRLLAFWEHTPNGLAMVVATHGFIKKTDKTPGNEIERAKKIRENYFNSKK